MKNIYLLFLIIFSSSISAHNYSDRVISTSNYIHNSDSVSSKRKVTYEWLGNTFEYYVVYYEDGGQSIEDLNGKVLVPKVSSDFKIERSFHDRYFEIIKKNSKQRYGRYNDEPCVCIYSFYGTKIFDAIEKGYESVEWDPSDTGEFWFLAYKDKRLYVIDYEGNSYFPPIKTMKTQVSREIKQDRSVILCIHEEGKGKGYVYANTPLTNPAKCVIRNGWPDLSFFDEVKEGRTKTFAFNGGIYTGTYKDLPNGVLIPHGKGKYIVPKILTYDGDFVDGRMDGSATCIYEGKGKYSGTFSDNKRHHGKFEYSDGTCFDGRWTNDEPSGGKLILADGKEISASFRNWKVVHVIQEFPNGDWYNGDVVDFTPNGDGHYYNSKENRRYDGEFKDGVLLNGKITIGRELYGKLYATCTNGVITTEAERKQMKAERQKQVFGNILKNLFVAGSGIIYNLPNTTIANGGLPMFNSFVGPSSIGYVGGSFDVSKAVERAKNNVEMQMQNEKAMQESSFRQMYKSYWGKEPSEYEVNQAWIQYQSAVYGSSNSDINTSNGNSNYNASNSDVIQKNKEWHDNRYGEKNCYICHGSGQCQTCNGNGVYYPNLKSTECPNCLIVNGRRSGKCRTCQGDGKVFGIK